MGEATNRKTINQKKQIEEIASEMEFRHACCLQPAEFDKWIPLCLDESGQHCFNT